MVRFTAMLLAVVALAAPTAAVTGIIVNGTDPVTGAWEFEMAGTNGGKSGIWHKFGLEEPLGYSHTFDTQTYEFFTPGNADVADFVAASPTTRSAIGRKLKFRFQEAVDYCQQMHNASLVSIRNRNERDFVISILPNNLHGWWLGVQRNPIESAERYSNFMDGTPVTYFSWAVGEPTADADEHCIFSGKNNDDPSKWVDAACSVKRRAVCKRVHVPAPEIVTTTSTVVPRTRGAPVGDAFVGIDDYGACYTNDDPSVTAQRSAATEPARASNDFTGNTYKIRNYTGSDIGVDPAVVHYAEPFCCYKYVSMPKETFHDAEAQCQAWGEAHHSRGGEGHLARVVDHEMNFFLQRLKIDVAIGSNPSNVQNIAPVRDMPWIGGRVEDKVAWNDERLFDGTAVQPGWEPWFSSAAADNASMIFTQPDTQSFSDSCIHMGGSGGPGRNDLTDQSHWSDGNCAHRRPYICSYCSVPDNTNMPTPSPTVLPTVSPTPSPTPGPTVSPSTSPTPSPTTLPTWNPTPSPTSEPSCAPSPGPTPSPTVSPTRSPSPDRGVCGEFGFLEYMASPGWDGIGGNGGRNSFCCYKHLSPAAGQRMDFDSAQDRCGTLGGFIAAAGNQTMHGRGDLAEITGPHMNNWLTTVVYDSASDGNPDKMWIGATHGANGLRWRLGGGGTQNFAGGYPWAANEPSLRFGRDCNASLPAETQAEFDVRCPVEECVAVGDGTVAGVSTWNDAQCSIRRQALCQYCYEPPLIPTEEPTTPEATSTTTTTTEEPYIDCGQRASTPPTVSPSTAGPTSGPTPAPTSGTPTSVPTVNEGFCTDANGWLTYDGPDADLGFVGRNSEQAQCCYKYFSAGQSLEHRTQSEASAYCESLAGSAGYPGASNLAFSSSTAVNDFLWTVRDRVFNSENDKSWIAGKVTRNADGMFVVTPDATQSGGTGPDGQSSGVQQFVFANGSNPQYPWYLGEPSMTIYTGNGDVSVANGGTAVEEGCVQMGKGRAAIEQGLEQNLWNDALCTKKRPFFCQYCYTPPDAFTDTPTASPTPGPSESPTFAPTQTPTNLPTMSPTTSNPTVAPTGSPTASAPTVAPTFAPTVSPTASPTMLNQCSESFAANRILDLTPDYAHHFDSDATADRWSQTCYGSARNTTAWLCGCFMKMRVADRTSLYPNDCRLVDLSDQMSALAWITDRLAFDLSGSSATCPNENTPDALISCNDLHCSNQCRSVADGGAVPNDQQEQCGWSRKKNNCKSVSLDDYRLGIGARTQSKELGTENMPGACVRNGYLNHQARCAQFTCGQLCRVPSSYFSPAAAHPAAGCGWSSRRFACIYGGTTTDSEINAGYCGLR